jgi:hypothetical protein
VTPDECRMAASKAYWVALMARMGWPWERIAEHMGYPAKPQAAP